MEVDINIAEEIAGWYVCYPDVYNACRERWFEFIHDPGADPEDYAETLSDQIEIIEDAENVPNGDGPEVVSAAFWGASADTDFAERGDIAVSSSREIKRAVKQHIDD